MFLSLRPIAAVPRLSSWWLRPRVSVASFDESGKRKKRAVAVGEARVCMYIRRAANKWQSLALCPSTIETCRGRADCNKRQRGWMASPRERVLRWVFASRCGVMVSCWCAVRAGRQVGLGRVSSGGAQAISRVRLGGGLLYAVRVFCVLKVVGEHAL